MDDIEARLKISFSERFSKLLSDLTTPQYELASELGCSPGHITHLSQGRSLPKAPELVKIAQYFGTSIDYLLGLVPDPDTTKSIRVVQNQTAADKEITNFIERNNPTEVYLIQYSSAYILNVLQALRDKKCKVYLLVKHPGIKVKGYKNPNLDEVSRYQTTKIVIQLITLLNIWDMRNNPDIQIRCYTFPGAMRAVYVGSPLGERLKSLNQEYNRLSDADDKKIAQSCPSELESSLLSLSLYRYTTTTHAGVLGESNPHFHIYSSAADADKLYKLFEDTFFELWENGILAIEVLDIALKDRKIEAALAKLNPRKGQENSASLQK